ncbi:O-acetylhomoserine sulfhydrylase [Chitinispirillum alkaliphilum]|nr:O-acetylhomoserine sulfhydrylase [Chitinispirillum alkaliphilum]
MKGFTTRAVHGKSSTAAEHGALRPPLYEAAAFEFESSADLELAFRGNKPLHVYSRITNPTVAELEQRVGTLTRALGVVAVSSGMSAIALTLMSMLRSQMNIVTSRNLFGNTYSLFDKTLRNWGIDVCFVDMADRQSLTENISDKTGLVFLESITNPGLEVADIAMVCDVAAGKNVPVVLDNTVTTPYIFDSKSVGVAVEVLSSTKYISGGATCIGGLIIDNGAYDWSKSSVLSDEARRFGPGAFLRKLRGEVYRNVGACLSPHNAWLQILGLETLSLRIGRSCENALRVARALVEKETLRNVNYPGLTGSPFHSIAKKQFGTMFGSVLTFELDSKQSCFSFMDKLKIIRRATNLNDNKSLIIHPASTIYSEYTEEQKRSMGVFDTMVRLSVGIEDFEDIINDIDMALREV